MYEVVSIDGDYANLRLTDEEGNVTGEDLKLVAENLENAKLRKNGIVAALLQKEHEYKETSDKLMREMHRFGW